MSVCDGQVAALDLSAAWDDVVLLGTGVMCQEAADTLRLNAIYQYLPIEFYQQFLKTLMTVLCRPYVEIKSLPVACLSGSG